MLAPAWSLAVNRVDATTDWFSVNDTFGVTSEGGPLSTGATTWKLAHAPHWKPSNARTHSSAEPEPESKVSELSGEADPSIASFSPSVSPLSTKCPGPPS